MLPDDVYKSLKDEADRRQATIAEIVRRGIDRLLLSAVPGKYASPTITPVDLGVPTIPVEDWRAHANER